MFQRLFMGAVGILFGGTFGFVAGGILVGIFLMPVLLLLCGYSHPVETLDQSFNAQPRGWAALLVIAGESAVSLTGARLGWRLSGKLYRRLPESTREKSKPAFVIFVGLALTMLAFNLNSDGHRFLKEHASVAGRVVSLHFEDHGQVDYTFTVAGRTYQQRGSPGSAEQPAVGDAVQVYYLPDRPSFSSLHKPGENFYSDLGGGLFLCAFASFWLTIAWANLSSMLVTKTPFEKVRQA